MTRYICQERIFKMKMTVCKTDLTLGRIIRCLSGKLIHLPRQQVFHSQFPNLQTTCHYPSAAVSCQWHVSQCIHHFPARQPLQHCTWIVRKSSKLLLKKQSIGSGKTSQNSAVEIMTMTLLTLIPSLRPQAQARKAGTLATANWQ